MLNYRKGNFKFWLRGSQVEITMIVIFTLSAFMCFCSPMFFVVGIPVKQEYKVGTITSYHKKQLLHLLEQCMTWRSTYLTVI